MIAFNPDRPVLNLAAVNQQVDHLKLSDYVLFDRTSRGDFSQTIAPMEAGEPTQTEVNHQTMTIAGVFSLGASFGVAGILVASDRTFLSLFPSVMPPA